MVWIAGQLTWSRTYENDTIPHVIAHARRGASGVYGWREFRDEKPIVRVVVRDNSDQVVAQHVYRGVGRGEEMVLLDGVGG